MIIKNRKAEFDFIIDAKLEVGIVLTGDEVKSIRTTSPSLSETYCYISNYEIWLKNFALSNAKNSKREKKLLLHKNQIRRWQGILSCKSKTIIPIEFYETKKKIFKLVIAIASRANKKDKRDKIKERDLKKINNDFNF